LPSDVSSIFIMNQTIMYGAMPAKALSAEKNSEAGRSSFLPDM